jgi:Mg2+ and Co2+ transporter CorA
LHWSFGYPFEAFVMVLVSGLLYLDFRRHWI